MGIGNYEQRKPMFSLTPQTRIYSNSISGDLTFTGLVALLPCVIKVRVANLSTLLEPRTSTSATSEFAAVVGHTIRARDRDRGSAGDSRGCSSCCAHVAIGKH